MKKRSLTVAGHQTSVSLEDPFWQALTDIARQRNQSIAELVGDIDAHADGSGLSSRIRLYILAYYQRQLAEQKAPAS